MVKTRSQEKLITGAPSTSGMPVEAGTEAYHPPPAQRVSTRSSFITQSSRASATIVAKKLAAEAQHARRLAQLEIQVAELEHRAELAAIDAEHSVAGSRSGRSDENIREWLRETANPLEQFGQEETEPAREPANQVSPERVDGAVPQLVQALEDLAKKSRPVNKNIVNLPVFDGKSPLDWLMFKRAFQDTVVMFTDAENRARLNQALKGAARDSVSMLLVMARQAEDVIATLDSRFGRPEQIVLQEVSNVRALPKLGPEVRDLSVFATRVRNCVEVSKLLEHSDYLRSPELFVALLSKLSPLLRTRWLDFAATYEGTSKARVEILSEFLNREVDLVMKYGAVAEAPPPVHHHRTHAISDSESGIEACPQNQNFKPHSSKLRKTTCLLCKHEHQLSNCHQFKTMTVDDRWHYVKENKICGRCLQNVPHSFKFCYRNKANCTIPDCRNRHHTLLHRANIVTSTHVAERVEPELRSAPDCEQVRVATSFAPTDCLLRPLLKVIAVTISGPNGKLDTFALLDDGSTATFIDADAASKIGAVGPEGHLNLNCVGGLTRNSTVQYVDFNIKGRCSSSSFTIQRARSINDLGLLSQSATRDSLSSYPYLNDLVEELSYDEARPTLIIGIDNWHLITALEMRKGTRSQPVAVRTPLGWVVFGFASSKTRPIETSYHVSLREVENPHHELETLIKEQYKLDAIGIMKHEPRSLEDQRALSILEQSALRLPDGSFQVGLLWAADNLVVPDSYPLAFSRFKNLELKMSKDREYAKQYKANIQSVLDKGYAEECKEQPMSVCWYLPHFGVVNPNKPGKLRVVHDAAAKVRGVSLNSLLLSGPDLLQPLLGILMRFREGKIALTADIKEMFPQVKIQACDRDAQRFLWRDDPAKPIKTYRMSSMIFGACSSPTTAIYIINRNASEFQAEFPEATHAIKTDTYMDDYIGSVNVSINQAARLAADIFEVHKRGGFEMRGWVSNEPDALSQLPNESLSNLSTVDRSVDLGSLQSAFTRTLGLIWEPFHDVIGFNVGLKNHSPADFTKREVLAQIMRIYDPLGILAPIVVKGRILFQNLWRKNLGWDEKLLNSDKAVWIEWFDSLSSILSLRVPRCYNLSNYLDLELHVFCDASELAYAAVAYWRFVLLNGDIKIALIASKARVSPLKPTSIPRLELQGALIASRLAAKICDAHRIEPKRRYFWCDSMTVLGWLRSDARNYKPYVAHRIGEILESTSLTEWHWVPTEQNVADDATRGKHAIESRWLSGPDFLLKQTPEWPKEPQVVSLPLSGQEELKPFFRHDASHQSHVFESIDVTNSRQLPLPVVADITHFSSWIRLVRATARIHQFIASIFKYRRHPFNNKWVSEICAPVATQQFSFQPATAPTTAPAPLNAGDIKRAERHILGWSQFSAFKEELQCLTQQNVISKYSRLASLSPVLKDGLLCVTSRTATVHNWQPIILDGKDPVVHLLVFDYHVRYAHANTETVINELRQDYWILGVRNAVRSVAHKCQRCKLLKTPTLRPPMANLPEARLAHHQRPFSYTGIDYFGPLTVTIGRRREKRWVALFTCMVTRAVHLEIVANLSADSAVMCLRRFVARRGTPSHIYSDNGTAFVGANRQMRTMYDAAVSQFATNKRITWHFIPPSAPFMGGAWERLIRSVKTAMKVTLKERAPREEVLATLLAEAEAIVNARPLTHVSPEANWSEALTPNHFLLGASSGRQLPIEDLDDTALVSRSSWRKAMRLSDHFWRRWVTEYLPTLAPRRVPGADVAVKVGDPVLIGDGDLPRGTWPRGVIAALFPGRDGVVRVVDVRTQGGLLRRPLRKIVPL